MAIKVTVELLCSGCKKNIKLDGRPRKERCTNWIQLDNVFQVEWDSEFDRSNFEVRKGFRYYNGDEAEEVYCSVGCVERIVSNILPKMKPEEYE
jgi:polyisoprenoid-binding protein YceI